MDNLLHLKAISEKAIRQIESWDISKLHEEDKLGNEINSLYAYAENLLPDEYKGKVRPVLGVISDTNKMKFGWQEVKEDKENYIPKRLRVPKSKEISS